jgi:hypothetical protein
MSMNLKRFGSPSLLYPVFLLAVFFYLRFRVDPSLYVIAQEPVFEWKSAFFADRLSFPGGMVDALAAFLSQYFIHPAIGAAIIALIILSVAVGTLRVLRSAGAGQGSVTLSLLPAVLALALLGSYYHRLATTIGFSLALWTAAVCCTVSPAGFRTLIFFAFACALYDVAGAPMLLFALIASLHEMVIRRRFLSGALYVIVAAAIPYAAASFMFLISLRNAYLQGLPFGVPGYNPVAAPWATYAIVPLLIAAVAVAGRFAPAGKNRGTRERVFGILGALVLIVVTAVFVVPSVSRIDRLSLRFCRMSRDGEWQQIYRDYLKYSLDTRTTGFALDEALYYSGLLPTDLFTMPQHFGDQALLLYGAKSTDPLNQDPFFFLYRSDLYRRLALVNEAEQWAYESVGLRGETPGALRQLALLHAAKGELPAARICLALLETMPLEASWAREFRKKLADSTLPGTVEELQAAMPAVDYIRKSVGQPCSDLEAAVRQNRPNRMAFEYCMASYLLQGNVRKVASLADCLVPLGYQAIPRLYEEALVILASAEPGALPAVAKGIDPKTIADYVSFNRTLAKYHGDFGAADHELLDRYWNSYWYYCFHDLVPGKRK